MQDKKSFEQHVGSNFKLSFEDGTSTEISLKEVSSVRADTTESGQSEPFSLLFQSDHTGEGLEQGTYVFQHEVGGEIAMFIVPIGPDAEKKGMCYEAVYT